LGGEWEKGGGKPKEEKETSRQEVQWLGEVLDPSRRNGREAPPRERKKELE